MNIMTKIRSLTQYSIVWYIAGAIDVIIIYAVILFFRHKS